MKKTRKQRNLTIKMAAKWKGISSAALYQSTTARREQIMEEFREAVESGAIPDPRLD
jgi:uncharacterized protein YukE